MNLDCTAVISLKVSGLFPFHIWASKVNCKISYNLCSNDERVSTILPHAGMNQSQNLLNRFGTTVALSKEKEMEQV
jgi:hypothetical protein